MMWRVSPGSLSSASRAGPVVIASAFCEARSVRPAAGGAIPVLNFTPQFSIIPHTQVKGGWMNKKATRVRRKHKKAVERAKAKRKALMARKKT